MKKHSKNSLIKNILSALAVAFFGFILLNLTFIFDALYQGIIRRLVGFFMPPDTNVYWFPALMHISFVLIIGIIAWFVFSSKLSVIYKAIFMTVPVAVVLVTIGMFLNHWPILAYSVSALLCAITLYYFHLKKQPWLYYYTVVLVGLTLGVFTLVGGEI